MAIKYCIIKMCSYDLGKVTPYKYFINNIQLENVTFYKDLGIIFENNLLLINILIIFVKKLIFL